MQSNLISSSRKIGIFEGTKIVGKLAAKEDFNPGLESSKTIELFLFMPLNWIALNMVMDLVSLIQRLHLK